MSAAAPAPAGHRNALVFSGGGARGAYEAGVLAHMFEHVYPRLSPDFEFDLISGTSVGSIHAAYTAASSHMAPPERARRVVETWSEMRVGDVLDISVLDLLGLPLRALGVTRLARRIGGAHATEVLGGLVDIGPLERLVDARIPWHELAGNLARGRPGALCVSCTEVRSGRVTVFMDGPLADNRPWAFDPNARVLLAPITSPHVRASAAIPFLFPAVRIGEHFYVDGGLRMNTPLSPALRLRADCVVVVALKHQRGADEEGVRCSDEVITQPAFMLGKVLDALMLDQLEYELARIELVNAWIDRGEQVYGDDFLNKMNVAVREQRGVGYRKVQTLTIRPSEDLGRLAAHCYREKGGPRSLGLLPSLITRAARFGVPADEADLLSYLLFDRSYTRQLIELGRADARAQEDQLLATLGAR